MKKLRDLWESTVYAGMKPGAAPGPPRIARLFGPLRGPVERFLAGGVAPTDPLYLSNRTVTQRFRFALVVAVPLILVAAVVLAGIRFIGPHDQEQKQLTPKELAAKMLPDFSKTVKIQPHNDIEVLDAHMEDGGILLGAVKNTTDHDIENVKVIIDLITRNGARMGAVAAVVPLVGAKSTSPFRVDTERPASYALVREVELPSAEPAKK
jgi:hypothetical protein